MQGPFPTVVLWQDFPEDGGCTQAVPPAAAFLPGASARLQAVSQEQGAISVEVRAGVQPLL